MKDIRRRLNKYDHYDGRKADISLTVEGSCGAEGAMESVLNLKADFIVRKDQQ